MHALNKSKYAASFLCGLLAVVMGGEAAAEQAPMSTAPMCIPESTERAIVACPAGARKEAAKEGGSAPVSRMKAATPKKAKKQGPTGPSLEIDLSTRLGREQTRARAENLLEREIAILQRLVKNSADDDPRRPEVLLRLAETQFEMQIAKNAKVRSFDDPIYEACTRDKDKALCKKARDGQKAAQADLDKIREDSIRTYATLVRDHPNFQRMDEVLFSLAFALQELDQFEKARSVYRRLVKDHPRSRFVPNAYLSFAEYYFNDSDMDTAAKFYRKVLEFPPKRNSVYGYALYKVAWVEYNRERYRQSLQGFVDILEFARNNKYANDAKNLARQARKELVLPYSHYGSPGKALDFFRRYSKSDAEAHEMLENLAELYYDTGQWSQAITVYHKLMADAPRSISLCDWQTKVTSAVISSRPKQDQIIELKRLVDVYRNYKKGGKPADKLEECKVETATTMLWLGTSWHREAVGTDASPGTKNKKTMSQAAVLYRTLLKEFSEMEQMKFPNIDKRDWPTKYKLSYFYAELLWKMEEWAQCGPAFDNVVEQNSQGEYTSDAAYAAVLCYNNLYQQQYVPRETETKFVSKSDQKAAKNAKAAPKSKLAPKKLTPLQDGMLEAFNRYLCYVDKAEDLSTIKYRRARIYYEANRFEEAAVLFRDIAFNHKDSELAEYAANLYLDCLNVLGTQIAEPRVACVHELSASIDPMSASFCGTEQLADEHPDLCGSLGNLQCQVRRKEAETYQKTQQFKKAAATYVRIFRRHEECGEMDEMLYNAAINFEAAHLLGRAIQVRTVMIERFPESKLSKKAVYLIGQNFQALAYYEQAAKYYEQFARKFPGEDGKRCTAEDKENGVCPNAIEGLEQATFFRIGLGDDKAAMEDSDLFARSYRRKLPRQTSQVMFSIGSIYERQQRWFQVISHYRDYLKKYGKVGMPHQLIQANTAIGRAFWELNKKSEAKKHFLAAVKGWTAGAPKRIRGLKDTSKENKVLYIRQALDSAAESQFYLSEYKFADFQKVAFPQYRGGKSMARVKKWSDTEFKKWVQRKQAVLRAAEADYAKVAKMTVTADGIQMKSAPWQIAAASRTGEMYRSFVDEFRDAPIPKEIEKDPGLFDIYVGALDDVSEPLQRQAIDKFEFCLKTATQVRWFNKWSRSCEQELNGLNPRKYPVAAELRGEPNYVKATVGDPGAVDLGAINQQRLNTKDAVANREEP
ncbi:MAG: tetratricopeptide repeat protein [Deltaproteobacteria bacterium]|nr:tetratricopeptide repeat protein [Deltaproteobacteria bacterium]